MTELFRRHRYPTAFQLVVETAAGRCKATVIDINQGGARLSGIAGVKPGDRLTLVVLNTRLTGCVRWAGSERAGIAFTTPPSPALVDILRQGIRHSPTTNRFSSTGLREMR